MKNLFVSLLQQLIAGQQVDTRLLQVRNRRIQIGKAKNEDRAVQVVQNANCTVHCLLRSSGPLGPPLRKLLRRGNRREVAAREHVLE
jgi:hypothetical protein